MQIQGNSVLVYFLRCLFGMKHLITIGTGTDEKQLGLGVSPESVVVRFLSYYSSYQVCLSREGKCSAYCHIAMIGAKIWMIDNL